MLSAPAIARFTRLLCAPLAVVAITVLAGCDDQPASDPPPTALNLPDQILTDFEVEMTRGELKSATIAATRGVIYRQRDSMLVENLKARLFDSDGRESSVLWADSGLIRERKQEMTAGGNVRVHSRDSVRLTSDSLFWYGQLQAPAADARNRRSAQPEALRYMVAKRNVYLVTRDSVQLWTDTLLWNDLDKTVATDAFVTIVRRGEDTLRGRGLRSDDQLNRITIQESASGLIRRQPR